MGSVNNWLGFSPVPGAGVHPPEREWGGMVPPAGDDQPPKLEDFLGMQELGHQRDRSCSIGAGVGASSIGLSMIKSWLRSQPAPAVGAGGGAVPLSRSSPASTDGAGSSLVGRGKSTDATAVDAAPWKAVETFGQRTSVYRGVTKHRWTGRYEAHLWDNSCRREGQTRKGRQVYLGGYDKEDKAARAYDLAALKYWGATTTINFPVSDYGKELEEMLDMTRQEYVASLRRKSSGFSRGASIYRGVTRHHQHGRWQARIGRVAGNKDLYLGTFSTQEEAAEAYDIAAIKFRGLNAVTNFDMSRYDVQSIIESSILQISGAAKPPKAASDVGNNSSFTDAGNVPSLQLINCIGGHGSHHHGYTGWSPVPLQAIPLQYAHGLESGMWCKQEQDSAMVVAARNQHNLNHFAAGDGTHNFLQLSAVPDAMGIGEVQPSPSSLRVYSGSLMYNGSINYHNAECGSGYDTPLVTTIVEQEHGQGEHGSSGYVDDGSVCGGSMPELYGDRNEYCLSQDLIVRRQRQERWHEEGGSNGWVSPVPPTRKTPT